VNTCVELSLVATGTFEDVVRAELATLQRRAYRLTHEHEAAQDLVQDTLERAYRGFASFRPGTNARAWLQCIMRNAWISNHRRQAGAPRLVPLDEIEEVRPHPAGAKAVGSSDVEAEVVGDMNVASIHTAIENLPSRLRQVVVLADLEDVSYGTIAEALAIPIGTVASRLSRGRRQLRLTLSDEVGGMDKLAEAV
jgi:RNA polymerase sigma-70 factor (ECF subfamily)